jgi:polysaccharide biosynthesis protein PslH
MCEGAYTQCTFLQARDPMARILILTPQLPYPPQSLTGRMQGTTIRNFNLMAGLSRRHTIDLLTFAEPGADDIGLLQPYCARVAAEPPPRRSLGRRGLDTLVNPLPDMALRLGCLAMHTRLARLLAEERYDILQVEGIEMAPYALGAAPSARPRIVFDDHNAEYLLQKRNCLTDARRPARWLAALYSFIQWQKLAIYERRVCRTASTVVAVSEADRQAIRKLAHDLPVAVVPNGVDLEFYRPGALAPEPALGAHALVFTGKMDYRPNVDAVLWFAEAVLPLIRAWVPDARFYVVGQQPHVRLQPLEQDAAVVITGRVPDVRPYIAGAAVYVVPLRIGGGTRLKVLEAMAMGQAIVSTRLGCDGFRFTDGQEVRFADEPEAFATSVIALLLDRQKAAALGHAARAHVEAHFGWDAIVPLMERLY